MVALLAGGHRRCEVANKLGITAPVVTQRMNRLHQQWLAFQGMEPVSIQRRRQTHGPTTISRQGLIASAA